MSIVTSPAPHGPFSAVTAYTSPVNALITFMSMPGNTRVYRLTGSVVTAPFTSAVIRPKAWPSAKMRTAFSPTKIPACTLDALTNTYDPVG